MLGDYGNEKNGGRDGGWFIFQGEKSTDIGERKVRDYLKTIQFFKMFLIKSD